MLVHASLSLQCSASITSQTRRNLSQSKYPPCSRILFLNQGRCSNSATHSLIWRLLTVASLCTVPLRPFVCPESESGHDVGDSVVLAFHFPEAGSLTMPAHRFLASIFANSCGICML